MAFRNATCTLRKIPSRYPDARREVESVKQATMPTQRAQAAEDSSLDLSEFENINERPVQETATAKKIFPDPSVKGDDSFRLARRRGGLHKRHRK